MDKKFALGTVESWDALWAAGEFPEYEEYPFSADLVYGVSGTGWYMGGDKQCICVIQN